MIGLKTFQLVLLLSAFGGLCSGEKILFLLPMASRSHVHVFEPLMKALGERGHDILTLSPVKSSGMPPNVRQIQLITVDDIIGKMPNSFEQRKASFLSQWMNSSSWEHMDKACDKIYANPKFEEILKTEQFDLIIVDIFLNYCVLGVIPHFKAPSIYVSTCAPPPHISNVVANRLPLSFVPSIFLTFSDKMSFKERMINIFMEYLSGIMWEKFLVKPAEEKYRRLLPNGDKLPSIDEIQANVSMVFGNNHFTINHPRPALPDIIEVGGMHTRPPKPLPKDLDDFLTGSGKDGFIFFSLGSIVKAKEMPESARKAFLNVFSRLKQRVLWKWETETMPDLPKNVKLGKWLPQQDILGHPNCRLFMSHGGLLSTQESVYHGVPVLGLPVFGDQDLNIGQAVARGYAKFVEISDISEEKLEEAILELINNPQYSKKVKELSKLVKDLPQTPLEKAVFWSEYVMRHKGAVHMRSAARDLNFFQYWALDVTAALIAIVAVIFFLIVKCCKATCRCICGKESSRKDHLKKE